MKKVIFYIILFIIPILVLTVAEAILRLTGYGTNYETFVELEESPGQYFFNPEYPKKYFSGDIPIPSVIPDPFDKIKGLNTVRIFALGGSSAAGYPYPPNVSFPRILKRKLELYYPGTKFEVVNLGVSAVNSHFLRNIIDDVIEMKPDFVLIYAGHNEYYGSPGPGSSQIITGSPGFVQFILSLRELRLYQLVEDIISGAASLFGRVSEDNRATLMGEIIKEKSIPLNGRIYNQGLTQFKENLTYIYDRCLANDVNILVSKLTCNLMQSPLEGSSGQASEFYLKGTQLEDSDSIAALNLLMKAKDLDGMRFRAPEEFNKIIDKTIADNNRVEADRIFSEKSKNGITGRSLMTDHLHPNIDGYRLLADAFYEKVKTRLKVKIVENVSPEELDGYLDSNFPYTAFDSCYTEIKLKILLNNPPFTVKSEFSLGDYRPANLPDSAALDVLYGKTGWAEAHLILFNYFLGQNRKQEAFKEIYTLLEARPFFKKALESGVTRMMAKGMIHEAKHLLVRNHLRYPDFFTSKYLGIINMNQGNPVLAEKLLTEAAHYASGDAEVYFYLARARFGRNNRAGAIESLKKCLSIDGKYPGAKNILESLEKERISKK